MKAHFVITISLNLFMESQAENLIRSIKGAGKCPDSFFTIMTHDDLNLLQNTYLRNQIYSNNIQIVRYETDAKLKYPWSVCARWNIEPKADLIIGLDSDVLVLRNLQPALEELISKGGISGVKGNGFDDFTIRDWKKLFNSASITFPEKTYKTPETLISKGEEGCPYYINNGVVALTSEFLENMRKATKDMIDIVHKFAYNNFYITQKATTLAAYFCKEKYNMPLNLMPKEFNHLEIFYGPPNKNTYFYHYNLLRDSSYFYSNKKTFYPKIL